MQLVTNNPHMFEIAANLSVCTRSLRVSLSSKRRWCMMFWKRPRVMVSMMCGLPRFFDQQSGSDGTLKIPLMMVMEINAISSGMPMNQCTCSVCFACWIVQSRMMPSMSRVMKQRKLWRRLVIDLLALAVGSPSALYGDGGVKCGPVPTCSSCHTVPSFAVSVTSVASRALFVGWGALSSSVAWKKFNYEQWEIQMISQMQV